MSVSDAVLKALGRVTVNFQFLESNLSIATWTLISTDQRIGQIVTQNLSFSKLCVVFSALVTHRAKNPTAVEEVQQLMKKASELEQRRNAFMHSSWATSEGRPDAGSVRLKSSMDRKKGWKLNAEELTPEAINHVADDMTELVNALLNWIFKQ
jgi:hypothetical protein